jgi:hypothetical protein
LQGRTAIFDFRLDTYGGQDLFLDDITVFQGCRLNLRVKLDGALRQRDRADERCIARGLADPASEPYSTSGYVFTGEGGGEVIGSGVLSVTGTNAIVDWVAIEVRDATDPAKVITSRAALLQRDGDVVDLDGVSLVRIGVPAGNYHIAIRHRGHLGAMSASPVALSQSMPLFDLSLASTAAWGTNARKIDGATALLWAGDALGNGDIKYTGAGNDRDAVLLAIGGVIPTNTVSGYRREDCNMDGVVKYTGAANDRDLILLNIGGVLPTAVRSQQLP